MKIDVVTLFVVFAMNCLAVGAIFLVAWHRSRSPVQLRAGVAALLLAAGIILLLLRGLVPQWGSIVVANTLVLAGVGLAWSGARIFEERPAPAWITFAGATLWLAVCLLPVFALPANRILFTSIVMAAYAVAIAREFSRTRSPRLEMRRAIAILLYCHAAILLFRSLYISLFPPADVFAADGLLGLLLAEPAVLVVALSIFGVGLIREQAERGLRHDAVTDDLTGVLNRRALLADAGTAMAKAHRSGRTAALLLFDLDHFKSINDRFGHSVGDEILRNFARIASRAIRQTDVFGRVGGEEFAAFLPGADEAMAHRIAERIRSDFSAETTLAPDWPPPTVSIGVAATAFEDGIDLDQLLLQADRALYEAKRTGRDRVVGRFALAS